VRWYLTREVSGAVVVGIDLVDHVLKLRLGGVLSQGPHDSAQLLGGDLACNILVSLALAVAILLRLIEKKRDINNYVLRASEIVRNRLSVRVGVTHHRHPCPTCLPSLASNTESLLEGQEERWTYKEGESLLELGNLLFGKGVGLHEAFVSKQVRRRS
jgi:hypothetical protein